MWVESAVDEQLHNLDQANSVSIESKEGKPLPLGPDDRPGSRRCEKLHYVVARFASGLGLRAVPLTAPDTFDKAHQAFTRIKQAMQLDGGTLLELNQSARSNAGSAGGSAASVVAEIKAGN